MAITKQQIIKSIHKGISNADLKYEKWTHGRTVISAGVEGLMVASVAEAVNECQGRGESLDLEYSFSKIREESGAESRRGRKMSTLKGGNRVDIVLFNSYDKPTCVIEIKRTWNSEQCLKDLHRIRDLIRAYSPKRGGSLRRGFLAMWIAKVATQTRTGSDKIREQLVKIEKDVDDKFDPKELAIEYHLGRIRGAGKEYRKEYPDWRAASLCIEIGGDRQRKQ